MFVFNLSIDEYRVMYHIYLISIYYNLLEAKCFQ